MCMCMLDRHGQVWVIMVVFVQFVLQSYEYSHGVVPTLRYNYLLSKQPQFQSVYQTLWSAGSASDHYLHQITQSNNQQQFLEPLQHKQVHYYSNVAKQSLDVVLSLQEFIDVQIMPVWNVEIRDRICVVEDELMVRVYLMAEKYFKEFYGLYLNYGDVLPKNTLPTVHKYIQQCNQYTQQKNRSQSSYSSSLPQNKTLIPQPTPNYILLESKIKEYLKCFTYNAAEDFLDSTDNFLSIIEKLLDQYRGVEVGSEGHVIQLDSNLLQQQIEQAEITITTLVRIHKYSINITQYDLRGRLKLPFHVINRLMKLPQKLRKFNDENIPKIRKILDVYTDILGQIQRGRMSQMLYQTDRISGMFFSQVMERILVRFEKEMENFMKILNI